VATNFTPDAWSVTSGTWGVDMDHTTVQSQIGQASIEFKNTTPGSNPTLGTDYLPCEPGGPRHFTTIVRADSIAGGNNVHLIGLWYTAAKAFIGSDTIWGTVLPAINTWYKIEGIVDAPANASFLRVFIVKVNNAFTAFFDLAASGSHPVSFKAYLDGDTGYNHLDTVVFDVEVFDYGSNYAVGTGIYTIPTAGIYTFNAVGIIDDLDATENAGLVFSVNGSAAAPGQTSYPNAANSQPAITATMTDLFARGDEVKVLILETHAGAVTLLGDVLGVFLRTSFSGFKVE